MNTRECQLHIFLLSLFMIFISCDNDDKGCCVNCSPTLSFYSLDRQGNDILTNVVDSGILYAFNANDGSFAKSWSLSPVPNEYKFRMDGVFDLLFIGNVVDKVQFNPPVSILSSGSIKALQSQNNPSSFNEVDRIYLGWINNFKSKFGVKDTLYVLPQTGMITIKVRNIHEDPNLFKGSLIIDNVSSGIDLNGKLLEPVIQIRKDGTIINKELNISAISFPSFIGNKGSSDPLTISTAIYNKETNTVIASAEKILTERLTPNKHIIIEYEFNSGNLVEFDLIIKDWSKNDFDSEEAQ